MGAFVVSSGFEAFELARQHESRGDDYTGIIIKSLADRFAEALAEWAHQKLRWALGTENRDFPLTHGDLLEEKYKVIRPAPGYAACPVHNDKGLIWNLLEVKEKLGAQLTENFAMDPPGTVAAWVIANPESHYFSVGHIGHDQFQSYIQFKKWTPEIGKKWLGSVYKL